MSAKSAMWCVIKTQTGIQGEAFNPSHNEAELFGSRYDALRSFRSKFAATVSALADELEYAEFSNNEANGEAEARVFGELAVVVLAVKRVSETKDDAACREGGA